MVERLAACGDTTETWKWGFEPPSLKRFRTEAAVDLDGMMEDEEEPAAAAGGGR
jgi:hypothetical protein